MSFQQKESVLLKAQSNKMNCIGTRAIWGAFCTAGLGLSFVGLARNGNFGTQVYTWPKNVPNRAEIYVTRKFLFDYVEHVWHDCEGEAKCPRPSLYPEDNWPSPFYHRVETRFFWPVHVPILAPPPLE